MKKYIWVNLKKKSKYIDQVPPLFVKNSLITKLYRFIDKPPLLNIILIWKSYC